MTKPSNTTVDEVQPDPFRQIAARYNSLYPDAERRAVSEAIGMTVGEAASLSNILTGEGATFRPGFFAALERAMNTP